MKKFAICAVVLGMVLSAMAAETTEKELFTNRWNAPDKQGAVKVGNGIVFTYNGEKAGALSGSSSFKVEPGKTYAVTAVVKTEKEKPQLALRIRYGKERKHLAWTVQEDKSLLAKGEFTIPENIKTADFSIWQGKVSKGEKITVVSCSVKEIKK